MSVQLHCDWNGPVRPAVNVKVYGTKWPTPLEVAEQFFLSEEEAERALNDLFDYLQEDFWSLVDDVAARVLNPIAGRSDVSWWDGVTVLQEGRGGGWLVVDDLPPVEEWSDELHDAWGAFETEIYNMLAYYKSMEAYNENMPDIADDIIGQRVEKIIMREYRLSDNFKEEFNARMKATKGVD